MKQHTLKAGLLLLLFSKSFAQTQLREGMSINVLSRSWENTLPADPKFAKASKTTREDMMAARNEGITSGQTESKRNFDTYSLSKEHSPDGRDNFKCAAMIIGREQAVHFSLSRDTFYIYRSPGISPAGSEGNKTLFVFEGQQKIPFNLQLNEALPVYEDLKGSSPNKQIVNGLEENGGTVWTYHPLHDAAPGLLNTATITNQVFYNVDAKVSRTDEFNLDGKIYNAYVIESETWTRPALNMSFEESRKELLKAENKITRQANPKLLKGKTGITNEAGYTTGFREEWFVPELGIVKTREYDQYGGIVKERLFYSIK